MRKLVLTSTLLLTFLAATAMACGGDDDDSSPSSSGAGADVPATSVPAAAVSPTTAAAVVQKIALKAGERGDVYYFSQSEIKLKPGNVEVTMTNDGPDRPHNFVVKKLDGSGDLVASERLTAGQSGTVTFQVVAATYQFICSLPGHADRGAKGTLVVAN